MGQGNFTDEYFKMGCWVSEKFKYHKCSGYKKIKNTQVNQGEVWYCDLGVNIGEEKNKMRPVIVVSNNRINRTGKVVVICITDAKGKLNTNDLPAQDSWYLLYSDTTDDEKMFRVGRNVPSNQREYNFLEKDSVAQCEEIRAVSKARLNMTKSCIGQVDSEDLKFIKLKLKRTFDIL